MKKHYFSTKTLFFNLVLCLIGFFFVTISGCKKPKNDGNNGDNIQPMYGVRISEYKQILPQIKHSAPVADSYKPEKKI